jgi:type 1 fimbria pilin
MAASTNAYVTFTYTELGSTGSSIIAPDGTSNSTNVGIQVGFNGTVLASGTPQLLGTMSSSTTATYTYTMQARYAKPSGTTAAAGSVNNATATYVMTYN